MSDFILALREEFEIPHIRIWPQRWLACVMLSQVHIIHLMSDPEGNSFVFSRVLMFWVRSRGKDQDSRENKTNWFPEGPDINCFVIFLDFHFNSNKRTAGANQNSRLDSVLIMTHNNTNLILKTTEWMIYKVLSLYYLHLFPPLAAVSLLG